MAHLSRGAMLEGRVKDLERRDRLLGGAGLVLAALGSFSAAAGGPGWLSVTCFGVALCAAMTGLVLKWEHERAKGRQRSLSTWRIPPCAVREASAAGCFYEIGVEVEAPAALRMLGHRPGTSPYLERAVDAPLRRRLDAALRRDGVDLIVVSGPSKAGKSRTLLQAAAKAAPEACLLAPIDGPAVAALARGGPPREIGGRAVVVWVDDLEEVAGRGDRLNVAVLNAFEEWGCPVAVLATHGGKGVLTAGLGGAEQSGDLLARYPPFELEQGWDEAELERLRGRYSAVAIERIATEGIGEFMIAAPRLVGRLRNGPSPEGQAVVRAAIDCRRAGLVRALGTAELESTYGRYMAAPTTPERFRRGLEWATEPLYSKVALLQEDGAGEYRPYDYIVGHVHRHGPPIDGAVWDRVVEEFAESEDELASVAMATYRAGDLRRAEAACRRGDDLGDPWASANLGVLLDKRGDREGAEEAYRRADARGSAEGAASLGVRLHERGDERGAEAAWRRADERDSGPAATNLGRLLRRSGDLDGALAAYRRADERGDPDGALSLGWQLKERGDRRGAEEAYRRAEERGSVEGAYNHGCLLKERGAFVEAEAAWRRADVAGHPTAASNLGFLLSKRGAEEEADAAYRRADERGCPAGAYNLGVRFKEKGDLPEAETAFRRADERGSAKAANALGELLEQRREYEEAVIAFRRGGERGDLDAANNLGVALRRLGDFSGSEDAFRHAVDRGSVIAMTNLGTLMRERGDIGEAETFWRRADSLGCPEASSHLGVVIYDDGNGDIDQAEAMFHRADERGSASGASNLGVLLWRERENLEGAMHAFCRADEREGDAGAFHLAEFLRWRKREGEAMEAYARADARGHARAAYEIGAKFHAFGAPDRALAAYGRAFDRAVLKGNLELAEQVLDVLPGLDLSPQAWVAEKMASEPRLPSEALDVMAASIRGRR